MLQRLPLMALALAALMLVGDQPKTIFPPCPMVWNRIRTVGIHYPSRNCESPEFHYGFPMNTPYRQYNYPSQPQWI